MLCLKVGNTQLAVSNPIKYRNYNSRNREKPTKNAFKNKKLWDAVRAIIFSSSTFKRVRPITIFLIPLM